MTHYYKLKKNDNLFDACESIFMWLVTSFLNVVREFRPDRRYPT